MSEIDTVRLARWIADTVDPAITSATATRLSNGYSGGAWRIDAGAGDGTRSYVLKAPGDETMVFRRDLVHEGRALAALHAGGAPVPDVLAIDGDGAAIGRPCLLMELVPGRGPADEPTSGYHDDPWLHGLGPAGQRAVWASFYDALAALHSVDAAAAPEGTVGRGGLAEVLGYWRASLLDVAPAGAVPRQLALLDWLAANRPPRAEEATAPCMGDARLANAVIAGTEVQALVDFEVLYLGNPAADVGYSTFVDQQHRSGATNPLTGMGTADEAWDRWGAATGRATDDRDYWTTFGATIIVVTATRAMVKWGLAGPDPEAANPLVAAWEASASKAGRT